MGDTGWVFLCGGAMSAWEWRDLSPGIREKSVIVSRRISGRAPEDRRKAALSDCVDEIVRCVQESGLSRLRIVAHSGSGILAPLAAARLKDRAERIIFVSANVPRHGAAALSYLPLPLRILNIAAARAQIGKESFPARPMEKAVRKRFCNASPEEVIGYVLSQSLLSEPLCMGLEKVDLSGVPRIPLTFIRLLRDGTASLPFQNRMAANMGITDIRDIDGDHMAMLSRPAEFNRMLESIASG